MSIVHTNDGKEGRERTLTAFSQNIGVNDFICGAENAGFYEHQSADKVPPTFKEKSKSGTQGKAPEGPVPTEVPARKTRGQRRRAIQ